MRRKTAICPVRLTGRIAYSYTSADNEMRKPLAATVDVMKALAHPARLRLVAMMRGGELCVCQMTAVLELAASTVSAHLADLKRAGLVEERKDARWVFHRLADGAATVGHLEPIWKAIGRDPQVEADARVLRELRRVPVEQLCRVELDLDRLGIKRRPAVHPPVHHRGSSA